MKRVLQIVLAVTLLTAAAFSQYVPPLQPQNNAAPSAVPAAGVITNPSGLIISIAPGPVFCQGTQQTIAPTEFTLAVSTTYYVYFNCTGDSITAQTIPSPQSPGIYLLGTVVTGTSTSAVTSITAGTNAQMFVTPSDSFFFVPESACSGAVTGTAGSGNATDIQAGSGGVRVFRLSSTNAGASTDTFTCSFQVPSKLTAGRGATINDITFLVSDQTTQATSVTTSTLKTFTAPAAVDPETANSATFVSAGGVITMSPTSAQFAAYTPVAAGQFFTLKATLQTPVAANTDLQVFVVTFVLAQSASAAMVLETPGFYVHYSNN